MLPFKISLYNHHPRRRLPRAWLESRLEKVCSGHIPVEIDFVDDGTILRLNLSYRHERRLTDVLAYDFGKREVGGCEVVISFDAAVRQSRDRNVPLSAELLLLCIHGLLHLLGYDDEDCLSRRKMLAEEVKVFLKSVENI